MQPIEESELIINPDGSVFHLHLLPSQVAENIILVGDPDRVETVARFFSKIECQVQNREFKSVTGLYNNKHFTVVSTGIGTDNIDIVLNELDACVNVDFTTRTIKSQHQKLKIVRIGTSGSLQADIPVDTPVLSGKVIGFDGLLNFYDKRDSVCDLQFETALKKHLNWNPNLASPYVVDADEALKMRLLDAQIVEGVTISAPGFYGPQGRIIRLGIQDAMINEKISAFNYQQKRITNYEMECSAIYGLSKLLGHQSATICSIIANRKAGTYSQNYRMVVEKLIETILSKLSV